ncbi:hypothetical protein [Isoptericola sp. BMS4]|uniref:hypothetical protein n=1 Tax=Isoptericola sp. BMS4 TaxID=2527875 RepID=UPI001423193E|nr:hypothetical protein [Isoptericola sp. BMS4]
MAVSPKVAKATRRFNPWALKVSSRMPPWSTLHHVGRRSGREYRTPVVAFAARAPASPATAPGAPVVVAGERDVLVVHPLPWGADVDWCRNIRTAGRYRLTRKGVDYVVDDVRVLDADDAAAVLSTVPRAAGRLAGIDQVVVGRLHRASRGDAD